MRISDWSSDVCSSDLRKRKLPVTSLLYALGMTGEEILNFFYDRLVFERAEDGWKVPFVAENWRGAKPAFEIVDAKTGEVVFAAGQKISPRLAPKAAKDGLETPLIPTEAHFARIRPTDQVKAATDQQ